MQGQKTCCCVIPPLCHSLLPSGLPSLATRITFVLHLTLEQWVDGWMSQMSVFEKRRNPVPERCLDVSKFLVTYRHKISSSGSLQVALASQNPFEILDFMGQRCLSIKPYPTPYKLPRVFLQADARLAQNAIPNLDNRLCS